MEDASSPALRLLSRLLRTAVGLGALAIAGAILTFLVVTAPEADKSGAGERSLVVRSIELQRVDVPRVWDGYGTARAMDSANVSAEVAGVVLERPVDIEAGRAVARSQTIIKLDPLDYEQRLEAQRQMAASLDAEIDALSARETRLRQRVDLADQEAALADSTYKRTVSSLEQGGANESEVEAALAALRRAEGAAALLAQELETIPAQRAGLQARLANQTAAVRLAERDLERTVIASPLEGLLQMVDAEEGELLRAGHVVARVVDLTRIEIPIRVPVSAGASIVVGDEVTLRADSLLEAEWRGEVVGVAPEADPASRSMTVFIEVDQDLAEAVRQRRAVNEEGGRLLLPGQFVVASVVTGSASPRFVVPRTAVVRDRLMLAVDGRAVRAPVRVLFHIDASFPDIDPDETQWAVLDGDGLDSGAVVITSNLDEISEGAAVRTTGDAP